MTKLDTNETLAAQYGSTNMCQLGWKNKLKMFHLIATHKIHIKLVLKIEMLQLNRDPYLSHIFIFSK